MNDDDETATRLTGVDHRLPFFFDLDHIKRSEIIKNLQKNRSTLRFSWIS
jgi:hypothetical protein